MSFRVMADARIVEYRGVMVVGKTGAGKSTVSNAIARSDDRFTVSSSPASCTRECDHCDVELTDSGRFYRMKVMDTVGLFDTGPVTNNETIKALKTYVHTYFPEGMNLIIFVLREGRFTPEEKSSFDFIQRRFGDDISQVSALVLTNCDTKDEKTRRQIIEEFKRNPLTKATADFMKAGIFSVGFPPIKDYFSLPGPVKDYYENSIANDKEMLWNLIKGCTKAKLHKQLYSNSFWELCSIV